MPRTTMIATLLAAVALPFVGRAATAGDAEIVARGPTVTRPRQPQAAVDEQGAIHVVWGSGNEIFHRVRAAGSAVFAAESTVSPAPVMALGMRRGPRVAASGGSVCITAIGGATGMGRDGDVWAVRTTDAGKTWSDPVRVNDVEGSAREGLHGMAAGPAGRLCCVWLDLRHGRTEVMAATSADGGATWGDDVLVYRSPEKNVCECCHPAVCWDGDGQILVQWRNSLDGKRDMFFTRSSDGGKTFAAAGKLGSGTWPLAACPMDGGAIAVARGKLCSTWRRDRTVYLVQGDEASERSLGVGEQPWLAPTPAGPAVAWLAFRGGPLLLLRPEADAPETLSDRAADPVVAAGPGGAGTLVAVWEESDDAEGRIMCRVIGAP